MKDAASLQGELLMIHGFADDNVYVAHALRMSKALMEAGRRHAMIPLSGITHRPTDERGRRGDAADPGGLPAPCAGRTG